MKTALPTYNPPPQNHSPSLISSLAKGTYNIVEKTVCVVGGVALVATGGALFALTTHKIYQFTVSNTAGLGDIPHFEDTCNWAVNTSQTQLNWPGNDTVFCESISHTPFKQLDITHKPAAAVSSFSLALLSYISSMHIMLAGLNLIGRSFGINNLGS